MDHLRASLRWSRKVGAAQHVLNHLRDAGYRGDPTEAVTAFVVDYALETNSAGGTLFSMFRKEHLAFNLLRLTQSPKIHLLNRIATELSSGPGQADRLVGA